MAKDVRYLDREYMSYVKDADKNQLVSNQIRPNERGECVLNERYHIHGVTGSQGVAFAYLLDEDYRVYACVYDVANKRRGNKYEWARGKNTGYTSVAQIDGLKESEQRAKKLRR